MVRIPVIISSTFWRRPRGRPPLRWTDQISEDIQLSHDDAVAATGDRAAGGQ